VTENSRKPVLNESWV